MEYFASPANGDNYTSQRFQLGDVPGLIWRPSEAAHGGPVVLLAHGDGQHKAAPAIEGRAGLLAANGIASISIDAPGHGDREPSETQRARSTELRRRLTAGEPVTDLIAADNSGAGDAAAEWRAVLDELTADGIGVGQVGYWGVSLGAATGVALLASDQRVCTAVLGLVGIEGLADPAPRVVSPVRFLLQWDDRFVPRESALELFDAFGSKEKSLHANQGDHAEVPFTEHDDAARFLADHLTRT
ncbi:MULTISPECIES: alpha/beta fold hydrolase [unclassified Arthrobacter]|uniref:alpha/beta fold hydrolase n=1 Tax=unclassified Arthrobacter TaxID=235627 RepID=UPI00149202EF|nr:MULTISPECIES: alpha/beta fold hydrolase [unclassified Arthrobacter]MBE0009750.1 alpha/beta fold hydrolase [Arthrobacter sp. AET 35A]NOJ63558.1 alpha/beta fold hydrolase [Arthrobacter sp. 147(2020)]